jgi:hypothetical protein
MKEIMKTPEETIVDCPHTGDSMTRCVVACFDCIRAALKAARLEIADKCIWWTEHLPQNANDTYKQIADQIGAHLKAGRERVANSGEFDSKSTVESQ